MKQIVMLDEPAAGALYATVSKNLALDALADLARGELGEDASDFRVISWIESRIAPVAAARNQRPPRIMARYNRAIEAAAKPTQDYGRPGRLRVVAVSGRLRTVVE